MKLLVSTPLQIFLFDTDSNSLSLLRTGDGYYYGISHSHGTIVITSTGGYLQYLHPNKRSIQTEDHLIQPHQVEWIENKILVANTGRNCISVFDPAGHLVRDVYLNNIKWDDKDSGRKGNHFNTVHKINESIFVVAHNYDRPSEIYELSWPDLLLINTRETIAGWAHNIWLCEWGLVICDSKNSNLINAETGEIIWRSGEKAMTRGLAASEDYIFVGYSSQNVRKDRFWKTGGLYILDRKSLKTIDKILFPGSGDVNEVRLLDQPDDCHNNEVIGLDHLSAIKKVSPFIALAYHLRKANPAFERELFPITAMARGEQMSNRWKRSFYRSITGH